jgi:glycosyltransferase involved in cell wall biosynthesis
MKVALVYDRVNKWGGAERVLLALHEIFPEAPLYTAVYHPETAPWAQDFRVISSFLNQFPLAKKKHEAYPFLMPLAFESFNFDKYEVVISVTSEAAKGIITKPQTLHLCYCLTPTRYLWSHYEDYFRNRFFRFLTKPVVKYLRTWDLIAAQRPDQFIAISENVQQRIKQYYGRDSEVIYPPLDTTKWNPSQENPGDYFLIVSRLVSYKRVDLAIEVFNQLKRPLKIIGDGREKKRLSKMAQKNIEFLGELTDEELLGYYQKSRAVIFPHEEDFGLVPLEAQASGRPVIAYRKGGALETVVEGKTGLFFEPQTKVALTKVLKQLEKVQFKPEAFQTNLAKFNQEKFKKEFKKAIEKAWKAKQ